MMARYLLAACVARTIAFQAARTSRRALGAARALPPHLETVRADEANCGFVNLIPICCSVEMVQAPFLILH